MHSAGSLLLSLAVILPSHASTPKAGATSGEILNLGWGARVPAMGGAMPAGSSGLDAAWYNPAGLSAQSRREIAGSYQPMVEGINQGNIGFARPWGGRSGVAVHLKYLDYGRQDRTTIATAGGISTVSRNGRFSAQDLVGGISAGRYFRHNLTAGVTLKILHSQLDNVTATAFAADFGAEWKPWRTVPFTIGAIAKNIGSDLKYDRDGGKLPLTFELGGRASFWDEQLFVNASAEKAYREDVNFRAGIEARPFRNYLALRAGYDGTNDAGSGLTAGAGIMVNDFTLDYAFIPYGKIGDNHRVALAYQFGEAEVRDVPAAPAPIAAVGNIQPTRRAKAQAKSSPATPWVPKLFVAEFEVEIHELFSAKRRSRFLEGAQDLRNELRTALASRGMAAESPSSADATIECEYWVNEEKVVTISATLFQGFTARARYQTVTKTEELAKQEGRAAILSELIARLVDSSDGAKSLVRAEALSEQQ